MIALRGRERGDVAEVPPPPVFWQKSPQADENKGSEDEKEKQEKPRVRNGLIRLDLRFVTRRKNQKAAKTRLLEDQRRD